MLCFTNLEEVHPEWKIWRLGKLFYLAEYTNYAKEFSILKDFFDQFPEWKRIVPYIETKMSCSVDSISVFPTWLPSEKWPKTFGKKRRKTSFHLEHTVTCPEEIQNWLDFFSNSFPRMLVSIGQLELAPVLLELHSHLHWLLENKLTISPFLEKLHQNEVFDPCSESGPSVLLLSLQGKDYQRYVANVEIRLKMYIVY